MGRVVHVQLFYGVVKEAALFFLRQKNGKNFSPFQPISADYGIMVMIENAR